MDVNFVEVPAGSIQPVIFEKVLGEKPGGGIVANPAADILTGTAVGYDAGVLKPIKAYRLLKAVAAIDTAIDIAKGSGVVIGDFIAHNGVGVESTNLDQTNATKDVVTVTMGIVIPIGTVLYQSAAASVAAVEEVKAGYYDAVEATEGALLIVAADAGVGEVLLATVQASYQGNEIIAAGQYVTLVALPTAAVAGVAPAPIYTPAYLTGAPVIAGKGDQLIKLVNIANVRKETVNASTEVLALLKTINAV